MDLAGAAEHMNRIGWQGRLEAMQRLPRECVGWATVKIFTSSSSLSSSSSSLGDGADSTVTGSASLPGNHSYAASLGGESPELVVAIEHRNATVINISLFDMGGVAQSVLANDEDLRNSAASLREVLLPDLTQASSIMFAAIPGGLLPLAKAVMDRPAPTHDGPFRCWVRPTMVDTDDGTAASLTTTSTPVHVSEKGFAREIAAPDGYELGSLKVDDAAIVNKRWPYNAGENSHTEVMIRDCIRDRPSAAVRDCESGAPVAWAVTREDGSVGMLHVEPAHRLKGLATVVIASVDAQLQARGQSPFFYISELNKASEKVASKLGFVPVDDGGYHWIGFESE